MSTSPIPNPNELRPAMILGGALAPGQALSNGVPVSVQVPIGGARLVTIRALLTCSGSLQPSFTHPGQSTLYTQGNPTAIAVVGNTEVYEQITANGEAAVDLTFTPSGNGVVSFFHVLQL